MPSPIDYGRRLPARRDGLGAASPASPPALARHAGHRTSSRFRTYGTSSRGRDRTTAQGAPHRGHGGAPPDAAPASRASFSFAV